MVLLAHSHLTFVLYPRLYDLVLQVCLKVRYLFRKNSLTFKINDLLFLICVYHGLIQNSRSVDQA